MPLRLRRIEPVLIVASPTLDDAGDILARRKGMGYGKDSLITLTPNIAIPGTYGNPSEAVTNVRH